MINLKTYNMKRILLLFSALMLSCIALWAHDVEIDGIYYNLDETNKTAEVTYSRDYYEYSGSITIPETITYNSQTYSVTSIDYAAFRDCRGLTSVTIPNSVTSIGNFAFDGCSSLTSITIPDAVTSIGNGAFYGCAYLESLVLPASLESIADNGFALCAKLGEITVHATEPPVVDSKTFENVNRSIPVHVPYGMGPKYRAAAVWQEFDIRDKADVVTGVDNVDVDTISIEKVIRNGQVVILHNDKSYNIMGQEVE